LLPTLEFQSHSSWGASCFITPSAEKSKPILNLGDSMEWSKSDPVQGRALLTQRSEACFYLFGRWDRGHFGAYSNWECCYAMHRTQETLQVH
jgi:hypothetical protein